MKITPVAQSAGQPGESLNSANVGRTADPIKLERARAIARGEKVTEPEPSGDAQADRAIRDVRRLKMKTNFSTNRDFPLSEEPATGETQESAPPPQEKTLDTTQSSTPDSNEPGDVEVTQPLSSHAAALAKAKRAFQLEKAQWEKEKSSNQFNESEWVKLSDLTSQPLNVLQKHGVLGSDFYSALTEQLLNGPQNPEIQAMKDEIKALREGVDKSFQTREEQAEEAALTEMLDIAEGLAKEGDAFEMIRTEQAFDQVLRLIHSTYKSSGRVMDVAEAMNVVEEKLLARAEKLASTNKLRSKFAPPAESAPLQSQQKPQGMRTLTARDTATPPLDRRARAIAAAMGTLKR